MGVDEKTLLALQQHLASKGCVLGDMGVVTQGENIVGCVDMASVQYDGHTLKYDYMSKHPISVIWGECR